MTELNLDNLTTGLAIELAPRRPPERSDADSGPSFQEHWQRTQAATPASRPVERQPSEDDSTTERPVSDRVVTDEANAGRKPESEPCSSDSSQPNHAADADSATSDEGPTDEPAAESGLPEGNAGAVATVSQSFVIEDIELAAVDNATLLAANEPKPSAGKPAADKPTVPLKPAALEQTDANEPTVAMLTADELSTDASDGVPWPVEVDAAQDGGQVSDPTTQPASKTAPQSESAGSNLAQHSAPQHSALSVLPTVVEPTAEQEGRTPPNAPRREGRSHAEPTTAKAPPRIDPAAQNTPAQSAGDSIVDTTVAADLIQHSTREHRSPMAGPVVAATDDAATPRLTVPSSDQPSGATESPIVAPSNSSASPRADRGDAWTLRIHGGAGTESARGLTDVERARLVQRVAGAFQSASERGAPIRLRLSPPELGSLRLEVAVRDGMMHARLEAESRQTQTLLIDNLPALRERLASQDIRLGAFDVGLMNSTAGGLPQRSQDQGVPNHAGHFSGPREEANDAVSAAFAEPASLISTGRLNVVI